MDERKAVIEDFMNWLAETGYELSFFDPEYEKWKIISQQAQSEIISAYLLTTAKTQQFNRDVLLNTHSSET